MRKTHNSTLTPGTYRQSLSHRELCINGNSFTSMKPGSCIMHVSLVTEWELKNDVFCLIPRYVWCLFYIRLDYNFKENSFKQHFKFLYGILMIGVTEMGVYDFHL